ncbi:MAG: hypothetical protein QMD43_00575 [Thermodesulfovibrio sp.]|uniref:hypothetical protein n=1 Tax=Thermodesulfovibrio sp. 1176 TaxID=3043424 RepID=UPI0024831CFD|nr:hypothetical protein [Thermodesulfovibrio sp. 1176]MDI1472805.1 hypothetical protein [Thermodesulfovibrio sp. 1176]MDI6713504.1 hypothetical protein [Thermodesulfovibrio sp.]
MFKDISSVTFAFVYVNILGYVFHSIVSRSLGPAGYGEFMVLYSFMLTVGNITALLATVSIKVIVENFTQRFEYLRSLRILGLTAGLFSAISVSLFAPYLKTFLNVGYIYYFYIIAFVWLGMFMLAVERSFLQSTGKFPLFAFSSALELTIRLIFAITIIYAGFKIGGVLFSSFVGIFTVLITLLLIDGALIGRLARLNIKKIITIALYASPSGFFVYADDIFIRRIFDEHTAGLFASVSIVGKVLVWFTLAMLGIYFPKFVHSKGTEGLKKFILQMVGIIIIAQIIGQIFIFIVGKPLFLLLFGKKFELAVPFLPYYFFSVLPLLFSLVFISLATAFEKYIYLIYIHLLCFYIGFILLKFSSIFDYLTYIFCLNGAFVLLYFWVLSKLIWRKHAV